MSFIARNHPQQVAVRGALEEVDDRGTPQDLFDQFDLWFHFTIDVAASSKTAKCSRYYSIEDDGLSQSWQGERVWCNPPYSNITPWVQKAGLEIRAASPALLVAMLLPANRTEQVWWQQLIEPTRDRLGSNLSTTFLPGRVRFVRPGSDKVGPNERPPFGCVLVVWQR